MRLTTVHQPAFALARCALRAIPFGTAPRCMPKRTAPPHKQLLVRGHLSTERLRAGCQVEWLTCERDWAQSLLPRCCRNALPAAFRRLSNAWVAHKSNCSPAQVRERDQHRVLASVYNVPSTNIMHTCLLSWMQLFVLRFRRCRLAGVLAAKLCCRKADSASLYSNLLLYACGVPELLALANSLWICFRATNGSAILAAESRVKPHNDGCRCCATACW